MNSKENSKERDPFLKYMNPESGEAAPSGFTEKVMRRVILEKSSPVSSLSALRIPLFAGLVVVIFFILAIFLPTASDDPVIISIMSVLNNIHIALPEFDGGRVLSPSVQGLIIYIIAGVFFLVLLDRLLNRFFHSKR
jgi:hypothetical protein